MNTTHWNTISLWAVQPTLKSSKFYNSLRLLALSADYSLQQNMHVCTVLVEFMCCGCCDFTTSSILVSKVSIARAYYPIAAIFLRCSFEYPNSKIQFLNLAMKLISIKTNDVKRKRQLKKDATMARLRVTQKRWCGKINCEGDLESDGNHYTPPDNANLMKGNWSDES